MRIDIAKIQAVVRSSGADAWVMYDFRGSNSIAWTVLGIDAQAHCTRRWLVVIPAHGRALKIVHRMEQEPLSHLSIETVVYDSRQQWQQAVQTALAPYPTLAIEYSPNGELPNVSKVDAGTVDFLKGLGHTVISSADIAQVFSAVLSEDQLAGAAVTAGLLRDAIFEGFEFIRDSMLNGTRISEYNVQQHIISALQRRDLVTDSGPIVAIGPNAANPHYVPSLLSSSTIGQDMVVLIDCWAKARSAGSVWSDQTWIGYTGADVPQDVARTFNVLVRARDEALNLITERCEHEQPVRGSEVDDVCRKVIVEAGMGSAFIHRTGHSITTELHGPGVNMDNYETCDNRQLLPGTSFSIEPGVYIEGALGLRSEIGVIIDRKGRVSVPAAPMQTRILPLLSERWTE